MKKGFLWGIAALLLLLPCLCASALTPCEHYPGQVTDDELVEAARVQPQPGVAGYVDLACPICGQIVDTDVLPPLPAPAEHPAQRDDETPAQPTGQEAVPDTSAQTGTQETPVSEQPSSGSGDQSEMMVELPVIAVPEQPSGGSGSQSGTEGSVIPAAPEAPATAAGSGAVTAPAGGGQDQSAAQAPPAAQDVTVNVPAASSAQAGTAAGGSGTASVRRRTTVSSSSTVSADTAAAAPSFPFRRIRMRPKPGIWAEAAGLRLWPVYGTPFQNLFND